MNWINKQYRILIAVAIVVSCLFGAISACDINSVNLIKSDTIQIDSVSLTDDYMLWNKYVGGEFRLWQIQKYDLSTKKLSVIHMHPDGSSRIKKNAYNNDYVCWIEKSATEPTAAYACNLQTDEIFKISHDNATGLEQISLWSHYAVIKESFPEDAVQKTGIYLVNLKDTSEYTLVIPYEDYLYWYMVSSYFDNGVVAWKDDDNLYIYEIDTGEQTLIDKHVRTAQEGFQITDTHLYYENYEGSIVAVDLKTKESTVILDTKDSMYDIISCHDTNYLVYLHTDERTGMLSIRAVRVGGNWQLIADNVRYTSLSLDTSDSDIITCDGLDFIENVNVLNLESGERKQLFDFADSEFETLVTSTSINSLGRCAFITNYTDEEGTRMYELYLSEGVN